MKKVWIALALIGLLLAGCGEPTVTPTVPALTTPVETTPPPTTDPPMEPAPEPLTWNREALPAITTEEFLTITGTADPRYPLVIGSETVYADEMGNFSVDVPLSVGENAIELHYLEDAWQHTVTRRYTTSRFLYEEGATLGSGATVIAEIVAREGSAVRIHFNAEVKDVEPSPDQLGFDIPQGFQRYVARFPKNNPSSETIDLGSITYEVTCDGITETYTTGSILMEGAVAQQYPDPSVTPAGYTDVGSGFIVEIVDITAETFNGLTQDDRSTPTRNYLPQGTVDYALEAPIYNASAGRYYYLMRCGYRVYKQTDNKPFGKLPVSDGYTGYLPDHNEVNVADFYIDGHHSELVLDCLWKAPFYFEFETQDYYSVPGQCFALDQFDATYIDITFCYATEFTGIPEIPADHPLFSGAELIQNEADHTLRLYLRKPGAFYGWKAYYNEDDQLCFRFLNPVSVIKADNAYGADLTGLRIMIDVGHGGDDAGACYPDRNRRYWLESKLNLSLAQALKTELESIGAEVIMNREDNEYTLSRTERMALLMSEEPDFCICIHHNADPEDIQYGFGSWYFTPYSLEAAEYICEAQVGKGIYRSAHVSWHFYYVARQSVCPVVLTENGFMTNLKDMDVITDSSYIPRKAAAMSQGIVDYYLSIS